MKTFTKIACALLLSASVGYAQIPGQPIKGVIVRGGKKPGGNMLISFGAGSNNPGQDVKNNYGINKGLALNASLYVPLAGNWESSTSETIFSIGLNAGAEYFKGDLRAYPSNYPGYGIIGQSGQTSYATRPVDSKVPVYQAEAGVQANFSFGKLTISPILNAGYRSIKQTELQFSQNNTVNGQSYTYNLYSQPSGKITGLALMPKLRVAYFPGKLGFYVEGNYTSGPDLKRDGTVFKPQGKPNDQGLYNLDQMQMGTTVSSATKAMSYQSMGFKVGMSLAIGKVRRSRASASTPSAPAIASAKDQDAGTVGSLSALLFPVNNQQQVIPASITGGKAIALSNYEGRGDENTKAVFVEPLMVSFATKSAEFKRRLKNDEVSLGYTLKQDGNGRLFAMPFPIFHVAPVGRVLMGCDNCNGCDDGGCGGTSFCFRLIPIEKDTLSGAMVLDDDKTPIKHQPTVRKVYGKATNLGSYTYQTFYNGEPVSVTIEYALNYFSHPQPQNRPTGKWCGCCIGKYCFAWWTTNLNADCSELCNKLNTMYDKMKSAQ